MAFGEAGEARGGQESDVVLFSSGFGVSEVGSRCRYKSERGRRGRQKAGKRWSKVVKACGRVWKFGAEGVLGRCCCSG